MRNLDAFALAYVEAELWTNVDSSHPDYDESTGSGPHLDDNYGVEDLADETLAEIIRECAEFVQSNGDRLAQAGTDAQNGQDFALTRNHHGTGFWDRGYGDVGADLTDEAHEYGETYWYVGEDGKVHRD